MNRPSTTRHGLGRTDFLHLRGAAVCVMAEHGTVWVTQDGEPDDIQLDAGQWQRFDGRARLIVSALGGDARVRVTRLASPRLPWVVAATRWLATLPRAVGDALGRWRAARGAARALG